MSSEPTISIDNNIPNNKSSSPSSLSITKFEADDEDEPELNDHTITNHNENKGLYYLLASQLFNSIMVISTKLLETDPNFKDDPINPLQILVFRMLITFIGTLIYMFLNKNHINDVPFGPKPMRKWLVLRGSLGFFGVFGLYFSLQYLSVSDAIVITFLVPSVTGILATLLLRERFSKMEGACALTALCGVILIVRPSFLFGGEDDIAEGEDDSAESKNAKKRLIASIVGLVGVCGVSSVYVIIKHIGKRAHAIMSVTYFSFLSFLISLFGILFIPSMTFKTPQTKGQWSLFFLIGFSGFFMQLLLTLGIQMEKKTSRSALMSYSQIIYAVFWDLIIWKHLPSLTSLCGIIIIVSSTLFAVKYKNNHGVNNGSKFEGVQDGVIDNEMSLEGNDDIDFELDDIGNNAAEFETLDTNTAKNPVNSAKELHIL
ncbi:DMT family transporter SCDLUD_003735 [Saccharomycodes ludwigii]|uniref:DMT family transporter n=1 Tax=Saccharomycodes ludwigii TaxID=36035 RepID=UPI001E8426BF|nr:hypothetical protein SCDLUD_003735 [Saccharomycodes ludwigii]KAH3900730.1 hypothetical protein SCDLUD_003735 [Saccharomycodes ludwigii]